jgi:zinc protease
MMLLVPVAVAAGPVDSTHGFWSTTLDNGLEVSILADPGYAVVATQIWVSVGSAQEAQNELGFAHLFEHLMFGATDTADKEAYSRWLTIHGGTENAYTSWDNTVFHSLVAAPWQDHVLELEADRFQHLKLDQANLDNEKKIVTEELRIDLENEPFSRLFEPMLRRFFGDHPYAHSPLGTKEDVAAADLALCQKFYGGYYRPPNLRLVIVGPVDGPAMLARATELFGAMPSDAAVPSTVPPIVGHAFPPRIELEEHIPPIRLTVLVYPTPSPREPDWWAMQVVEAMIKGSEVDRFREEIVTKKSRALEAQTISFDMKAGGFVGFGSVNLFLRGKEKAVRHAHEAVEALGAFDWATEASLATAKRRLLANELVDGYYAESRAAAIGQAADWQGDPRLGLEGREAAIAGVTLDAVHAVWKRYVADATPTEIVVSRGRPQ